MVFEIIKALILLDKILICFFNIFIHFPKFYLIKNISSPIYYLLK
ncbi:hypothetical protein STRDD11_01448 [Streptococcus sp. DD11]|nr:hypothetical protein STRDD11_01448 [Streptococcus sp. DD11]